MWWRHFPRALVLSAVVFVPVELVAALIADRNVDLTTIRGAFAASGISAALMFLFSPIVMAALVRMTHERASAAKDATVWEHYRVGLRYFPVLIAAQLVALAGVTLGLLLLIVPGVILGVRWTLVVPVVVFERTGVMRALGRSWELVRGSSWAVFACVLIVSVVFGGASGLLSAPLTAASPFTETWLGAVISDLAIYPALAVLWTLMYEHLNSRDS